MPYYYKTMMFNIHYNCLVLFAMIMIVIGQSSYLSMARTNSFSYNNKNNNNNKSNRKQSSNISAMHFLENYGYLPEMNDNELNLLDHREIERAIKLMQKYAHLPQTGRMDQRTMDIMKSPRCGVPDVKSSTTKYRRSITKRFAVYGSKWDKSPITWNLINPSKKVSTREARSIFSRAWNIWSRASDRLEFIETSDPNADILIGFYTGEHGDGQRRKFDGPGSKLAHAYAPPKGDVHFDDEENWQDKDGPSLFWTALHEFGHSLGFAHTADEGSIMFPYYRDYGSNFSLPEIDKAGVQYLYGDLGVTNDRRKTTTTTTTESYDRHRPAEISGNRKTSTIENTNEMIMCNTNIDAIASIRNEIFVFKNQSFWWVKNDLSLIRNEPIPISQYFIGFPTDINQVDAVYERRSDQLIMFFVGRYYYLFNSNRYHAGPIPLTDLGLSRKIERIDTIINWAVNGKAYIFTGSVYWRLDSQEKHVEMDYPRDISVWQGIPTHLDAAFTWKFDSVTYFFKGQSYWKFNNVEMHVQNPNPGKIRDFLFRSIDCRGNQQQQHHELKRIGRYDSLITSSSCLPVLNSMMMMITFLLFSKNIIVLI
uniref:Matrix metalloproteinase-2-like n=1 Tax=Dermatophagoides pteronyssinus TaxID=6956 RepID=A0A6P6YFW0_DERPT|nr:matrix metalloproteinase-2-like [Dermatophagoides pteronyssinus]